MSEALEENVCRMIRDTGLTMQGIADELGTTYSKVYTRAQRNFSKEFLHRRKVLNYSKSKLGDKNPMKGKFGAAHHNFKGACSDNNGYLTVVTPDWYDKDARRVFLHHVVYAKAHGLPRVPKHMVIHHIDGDPLNNSVKNLQMLTPGEHSALHARERATTIPKGSTPQANGGGSARQ